jgi:hypothetical protein
VVQKIIELHRGLAEKKLYDFILEISVTLLSKVSDWEQILVEYDITEEADIVLDVLNNELKKLFGVLGAA